MGRKQSPILNNNKLKLGFFSPNCSGGMSVTKVPERWVNSWDNNIRLAQLADEAGIEFLLPIARWIGYGGGNDLPRTGLGGAPRGGGARSPHRHSNGLSLLLPAGTQSSVSSHQ